MERSLENISGGTLSEIQLDKMNSDAIIEKLKKSKEENLP